MSIYLSMANLGWQPFFQHQLSLKDLELLKPFRVIEQHKSVVSLSNGTQEINLELSHLIPQLVVGDWILLDSNNRFQRLLERKSLFARKAAGTKVESQLIASNVDTAFIMCSLNEDFNLSRLERFLTLVNESNTDSIILLTKSDLSPDSAQQITEVQKSLPNVHAEAINCLDPEIVKTLSPWLSQGQTITLLGSSGVGKSTLTNVLFGADIQTTHEIRINDSKGRHTTTTRSLIPTSSGALLLDTPGMREVQIFNSDEGLSKTFSDIEMLAKKCQFKDCAHISEPGCAVQKAIGNDQLEERRFNNYKKLQRENRLNSATIAEKRSNDKSLSKYYKFTQKESRKLKGR